ncbi:hypothetical protein EG329_007626 [Mollisiaceae sp. DMI_Dod_QoI]|nr:hypothetical protein EG329_007626 [Helotiales sp. DMI_Dod_QoI]
MTPLSIALVFLTLALAFTTASPIGTENKRHVTILEMFGQSSSITSGTGVVAAAGSHRLPAHWTQHGRPSSFARLTVSVQSVSITGSVVVTTDAPSLPGHWTHPYHTKSSDKTEPLPTTHILVTRPPRHLHHATNLLADRTINHIPTPPAGINVRDIEGDRTINHIPTPPPGSDVWDVATNPPFLSKTSTQATDCITTFTIPQSPFALGPTKTIYTSTATETVMLDCHGCGHLVMTTIPLGHGPEHSFRTTITSSSIITQMMQACSPSNVKATTTY